ncbi:MAG: Ig-like domain-containing protein [Gemmatimonadales bacterium]
MHKFYRSVLLTGMVAVGLAGCGDDVTIVEPPPPPPPPAPTVKSISVAPNPGSVPIGGTITMSAAVVADAGVATTVTWSSSDASKATVNAASGVVTGVSAGSVAITATSTVNPAVQGNATVNVTAAPTATVTGVTVTPGTAGLVVGQTVQLSASVQGTNNPDQAVTWSSLSPGIASVSAAGLVTGVANGTAVIRGCSTATGFTNVCGSMSVTVTTPSPASVSIQSLTQGGLGIPVVLSNVQGQIEASINVDAGGQTLDRVDVLIDGVILASQSFSITPAPAEEGAAGAPVTVVLSFNTTQLRQVAGKYVPVVFNGQRAVTANLYVVGSSTPLASNAIPVVMNNPDQAIVPSALQTDVGALSFVNGGITWYKGGLTTNMTYLSYSTIVPATAIVTISGACGTATNTITGTAATGITVLRNWTCAATEGQRSITGLTPATYPAGSVGPDGSTLTAATQFSSVGGQFLVVGEPRWNLITPTPNPLPGPVAVDNLGPAIAVGTVAFNPLYDQQWINASYAFGPRFTPTDGGSGVTAGTLTVYEYIGTACTTSPAIVTGADFPETLTSDLADSKRVCTRATDNLGNTSASGPSNNFGVDKVAPSARLYFATNIDQDGTSVTPGVSATPNTSKYQNAPALLNQAWGLEAQDTRSGFNQTVIVGVDAATQSLTRLWPGVPVPPGTPTSACTLSDQLTTTLSDNWKRTMLPFTTLDCGAGVGYYFYSGTVNDRAGNFPVAPIVRNFVYDPGTPNVTGLGFDPAGYTSGSAATFSVAANDDLSVITGTITFLINGMPNPQVGLQYPHGSLNLLGTPWATNYSQLTHILNGGALTVPNLITRVDESCLFNGDPYASCDVTTNGTGSKPTNGADYNSNLFAGGVLTDSQKVPQGMITNIADIVGREAVAALITPILITQYNGSGAVGFNAQPWSAADIATWTAFVSGTTVIAEHKTITSNGLLFFDDASLWRLNGATNVWTFCTNMTAGSTPHIDNGSFRIWRYTTPVPAVTTECGMLPGQPWKVMGRKVGAGLFTGAF